MTYKIKKNTESAAVSNLNKLIKEIERKLNHPVLKHDFDALLKELDSKESGYKNFLKDYNNKAMKDKLDALRTRINKAQKDQILYSPYELNKAREDIGFILELAQNEVDFGKLDKQSMINFLQLFENIRKKHAIFLNYDTRELQRLNELKDKLKDKLDKM